MQKLRAELQEKERRIQELEAKLEPRWVGFNEFCAPIYIFPQRPNDPVVFNRSFENDLFLKENLYRYMTQRK